MMTVTKRFYFSKLADAKNCAEKFNQRGAFKAFVSGTGPAERGLPFCDRFGMWSVVLVVKP